MNRRQIIEFCNKEIFAKINLEQSQFMNCQEVVKLVIKFRRENDYPREMTAKVNDGFLYINGKPVSRIAPKMPRAYGYSERMEYLEGRCIG